MSHPIEIKAHIHTTSTKKAHFNHYVHLSLGNPCLHINGWNEGSEVSKKVVKVVALSAVAMLECVVNTYVFVYRSFIEHISLHLHHSATFSF